MSILLDIHNTINIAINEKVIDKTKKQTYIYIRWRTKRLYWRFFIDNDKRFEKFDFSNKQKGRGGARPGSGRKATGRKTKCLTITLTEEQAEVLQEKAKYAHLTVSQFIVKELNLPYKTEEKKAFAFDFNSFDDLMAAESSTPEYNGKN